MERNVLRDVLEEVDRKDVLLRAAYDLLRKCDESAYVLSAMETTVHYDGCECDGYCLMVDIFEVLELDED